LLERLHQRNRRKGKKLAQVARLWARDLLHTQRQGTGNDPQTDFNDALAAFGLVQEPDADGNSPSLEYVYLWPCNLRTFNVWMEIQTQWRTSSGMGGNTRTGLDYAGVTAWLRTQPGFRPRARKDLMQCLQAMEIAALNAWAQMRDENRHD
jgi:hypothetical protein